MISIRAPLRAAILAASLTAAASGAHAAGPELFVLPEGVRVDLETGLIQDGLADAEPAPLARAPVLPSRPIRLRAARDEVVAFQVALLGGEARIARAGVAPFGGGVRGEVFFERAVEVREPSDSPKVFSLGPGRYPDILIPTATVAIPAPPAVAVLWIDVFVPRSTPAGLYRSTVSVEGAEPIAVELRVLDLALPERDVAKLGAVSFGSLLRMEKLDPALLRLWMQLAHAHHLNVELMRPRPAIGPDGAIDWNGWAARFGAYLDGGAFTSTAGYFGPRAGKPVTRFVAPLSESWPAAAAPGGLLPSDGVSWSEALAGLERYAAAKGWLATPHATEWILFINALDEPKTAEKLEALARYGPLIDAANLRDRRRFAFRADGVLGARIEGWPDERKLEVLGAAVDLWTLHGATDTAPLSLLDERFAAHPEERAMFYASSSGGEPAIPPLVVDSAIAGARAWAWIVARYALAGALNWELDFAAGCVREPRCSEGGTLNLDALLIYRGHEVGRASFEPIPSMRLKALRRGAQDVALLALALERQPAAARRIAERMIPRALGDGLPARGRGTWPRSARAYDAAREEVLDLLEHGQRPAARPHTLFAVLLLALALAIAGLGYWARNAR